MSSCDITDVVSKVVGGYIKPKFPIYKVEFVTAGFTEDADLETHHHIKYLPCHKMAEVVKEEESPQFYKHLNYLLHYQEGTIFQELVDYWYSEKKLKNKKSLQLTNDGDDYIILDIQRIA